MENYRQVNNNTNYGGVGFMGLLAIVFITLKLTGVITWPWIWVLAPVWIPFVLLIIMIIIFAILYMFYGK